ncbi:hypothetical protein CHS0354_034359 [Potamilus streckersoni]|uniref:Uncharacterized protein n=1 Tax=Potamilus streckersoni TaxID=2493646 RepID=A0AAE0TJT7_9BIVA|nr:hypothetical protein CHS0354_034359 [Potamilus streckersoni]
MEKSTEIEGTVDVSGTMRLKLLLLVLIMSMVTCTVKNEWAKDRSGIHLLRGLCMPDKTDRLVYRHRNNTHVFIAFDILKQGKVQMFLWEIIKANNGTFISDMHLKTLPAVDFRKGMIRRYIVAATGKRHYGIFLKQIRRQMRRCRSRGVGKPRPRCQLRTIINTFVRISEKLRNVTFNCLP